MIILALVLLVTVILIFVNWPRPNAEPCKPLAPWTSNTDAQDWPVAEPDEALIDETLRKVDFLHRNAIRDLETLIEIKRSELPADFLEAAELVIDNCRLRVTDCVNEVLPNG